jgi:Trypsin-like peptidase domain
MNTVHNLPPVPAFRDEKPDSPISEIALRVVVECPGWNFYVVGTAVLIAAHVAITARHVLDHIITQFGFKALSPSSGVVGDYEVKLWQVLPGPTYRFWKVFAAWPTSTDVAIFHLGLDRSTILGEQINWRCPRLRVLPPQVGQQIVAFGYREAKVDVTEDDKGTHHINLNDRPTTSIGTIRQIYPSGRDRAMLPFPCFEIEARFDPGMSGGLVVDEAGSVCGLICASLQYANSDELPISYAVSLWPMLKTKISVNRGDRYPRDVSYPVIDLAIDGLIPIVDLALVDPAEFPDKQIPGLAK